MEWRYTCLRCRITFGTRHPDQLIEKIRQHEAERHGLKPRDEKPDDEPAPMGQAC